MARATTQKGFNTMDPDTQRAIASSGGQAAQDKGTAHKWTQEQAKAAGRKGGLISRRPKRKCRVTAQ